MRLANKQLGSIVLVLAGLPGLAARADELPSESLTNSIGMKLMLIPAGWFYMGAPEDEEGSDPRRESPRHRVRITKRFYLGAHEVTKGQFEKFVDATGYDAGSGNGLDPKTNRWEDKAQYSWRSFGVKQTDESPVVNVNWHDAQAFCSWLSRKEKKTYRLPTEAEWEYACRAATTTRYSSGDDASDLLRIAYIRSTSQITDGLPHLAPVGSFAPNAWGLFDMHGNACEWCEDYYETGYYRKSPDTDPQGPIDPAITKGAPRIIRSCGFNADVARSAYRFMGNPSKRSSSTGFRVVCEP